MHPANVKIILSNIRTSDYGGNLVSWQDTLFQKRRSQWAVCRCRKDFSVNEAIVDLRVNSEDWQIGRSVGEEAKFIDP